MILKGDSNKLFIGPFIGEFGHELFSWQAYMREYAKTFDHVVVASRKEYKFLYEDFCDEFIAVDPKTFNAASYSVLENEAEAKKLCTKLHSQYNINKKYTVISPNIDSEAVTVKKISKMTPTYVSYGNEDESLAYDILIHPRNFGEFTNHKQADKKKSRDWSLDKWFKLVSRFNKRGFKVGCIGLSSAAFYVEGTDDLRDLPLKELADVLRSSKCILGPSSGPLHFATLCECPQIVWSHPRNRKRYLTEWNPFDVKVVFHDKDSWNPSVIKVGEMHREFTWGLK